MAEAYGLSARRLEPTRAAEEIVEILNTPGPQVIAVELDRAQSFEPKLSSKRLPDGRMVTAPLEDMAPFLDRDEFRSNMLIPTVD